MSEAGAIGIGVGGALGRMGRVVAGLLADRQDLTLAALFDRPRLAHGRCLTARADHD